MIQRIQSVWLLLAAVCSFLTLKFEFYAGTDTTGQASHLTSQANIDRKSTRLNSSHIQKSRMPSSA